VKPGFNPVSTLETGFLPIKNPVSKAETGLKPAFGSDAETSG